MANPIENQLAENQNQLGGPYMIQDHDHMVESSQPTGKGKRARQADQSQSSGRQQGASDHGTSRQHGAEKSGRRH